ncbi:MAG: hypothetical protein E7207_01505 [Clostridium butyricum]|nr:hypothetical protein [Clostridium butyricum]
MSKEMNKLLKKSIKFDLLSGLLISLLIVLLFCLTNAMIYMMGLCVSLVNFIGNGYVIIQLTSITKTKNGIILILITFLRLAIVVLCAIPFSNDVKKIAFYMAGFISHYLVLINCCLINRKGSV